MAQKKWHGLLAGTSTIGWNVGLCRKKFPAQKTLKENKENYKKQITVLGQKPRLFFY